MKGKPVETMPISEFKATCLSVLERVRRTGAPVIITRRGEPIAEVVPPSPATIGPGWLGLMRKTATITGNLVDPAGSAADWEALG